MLRSSYEWLKKSLHFNRERKWAIKVLKENGEFFWANILEQINLPTLRLSQLKDADNICVSFYVPGILKNGKPASLNCKSGQFHLIFRIILKAALGINETEIPVELEYLLRILE